MFSRGWNDEEAPRSRNNARIYRWLDARVYWLNTRRNDKRRQSGFQDVQPHAVIISQYFICIT